MSRELNQFITDNCTKEMTSIDLDVCTLRWSKKHLRIIESKHTTEGTSKGQRQLYEFMADKFRDLIMTYDFKFEVMYIYGDPPYDSIWVEDLVNNKKFTITGRENVIKFLNMEACA